MVLLPWTNVQLLRSTSYIELPRRILKRGEVPAQAIRKTVELLAPGIVLVVLELLPPEPTPVLLHTSLPVQVGDVQKVGQYGGHRRRRREDDIDHHIELQWQVGERGENVKVYKWNLFRPLHRGRIPRLNGCELVRSRRTSRRSGSTVGWTVPGISRCWVWTLFSRSWGCSTEGRRSLHQLFQAESKFRSTKHGMKKTSDSILWWWVKV